MDYRAARRWAAHLVSINDISQLQLSASQPQNGQAVAIRGDDTALDPGVDGGFADLALTGQGFNPPSLDPHFESIRSHIIS